MENEEKTKTKLEKIRSDPVFTSDQVRSGD